MRWLHRLLLPYEMALKKVLESFIRLETADDERTLAAEDGSLITFLRVDGSRQQRHGGHRERDRHGEDRHERMLQRSEFDVAELSLSSYLMAKSRAMPFTAIPVFPRRLFSLSQMWVNVDAAVHSPRDLIGKTKR